MTSQAKNVFKSSLKWLIKIALILAVVSALFLYANLGKIVNHFLDISKIENMVRENTGLELVTDNFTLSALGDFSILIKSKYIKIIDPETKEEILYLAKPDVRLAIFPLLFKRLEFKNFSLEDLHVNISRDKNGVFNFSKYIKKDGRFPFKLILTNASVVIDKYSFVFNDETVNILTEAKGEGFISDSLDFKNYISFKTKGLVKITGKNTQKINISKYSADLKLKLPLKENINFDDSNVTIGLLNLRLEALKPYINEFLSKDINDFKGVGNFYIISDNNSNITLKTETNNFLVTFTNPKNKEKSTVFVKGKSIVSALLAFNKDKITVLDGYFNSDGIDFTYKGTVTDYMSKKARPDLSFKIKPTKVEKVLPLLPDNVIKLQQDYIPYLKKYNAHALVRGEFSIKERFLYPDMFGKIYFSDVWLLERPLNAKTSTGTVEFKKNKVQIDVKVNAPNNQYVNVSGITEIAKVPYAKFSIVSSNALDMAFAHKLLIPIHDIIGFKLGPLPFMTVAGNGVIDLRTEGTKESAKLNGFFRTGNATATLQGLNTILTKGSMNLVFKGDKIIFNGTKGIVENANINIDGTSDVSGNLDLKVAIKDVTALNALKVASTSDMVLELLNGGKFLSQYKQPKGNIDFNLHLKGKVAEFGDFSAAENMDTSGSIIFKNNSMVLAPNIKVAKINGTLAFTNFVNLDLIADIYNSPFKITGTVKPDFKASKNRKLQPQIVDLTLASKHINSKDIYDFFKENGKEFNPDNYMSDNLYDAIKNIKFVLAANINAKGKVMPTDGALDLKRFNLTGWATGLNHKASDVVFNSGGIKFRNQKMIFDSLDTEIWGANVITSGYMDDIFNTKNTPNIKFELKSFPLERLSNMTPVVDNKKFSKLLTDFNDFKGFVNGNFSLTSGSFNGISNFNNVSFYDTKRKMPAVIKSGSVKFTDNRIDVDALNMIYGTTPLYFDANIRNINEKPDFNAYITTNLSEDSLDRIINPMLEFPLKVKGELILKGRIKGNADKYTIFLSTLFNPQSDLSYMGANLGDVDSKREITSRLDFDNDTVNIKYAKYLKYIMSQNNKQTPYEMLNISGLLTMGKDDAALNNLKIITPNPAPARLLNMVFKKSILKQGLFTSDVSLKGSVKEPLAQGKVTFSNVNIPLYDIQISDVDLLFDNKIIKGTFTGKGFESDVTMNAEIQNKSGLPVVINKLDINSSKITVSKLIDGLADISAPQKNTPGTSSQLSFSPYDFIIKSGKINANAIQIYNIKAYNFISDFSHTKDAVIKFDNTSVDMAGGRIRGSASYEFDTTRLTVNSNIENCDANILASDIFGVRNQIFGKANGVVYLTGKDLNTSKGLNTVYAKVSFGIYDGKMPKLGSMEYLLRAGNFLKSGVLGFTINNAIELLIPYKTGEFKKISGNFIVQDGNVQDLSLYSQGENLSTYTHGKYNISTNVGDFEILGKLSKKVSNVLGSLGNASLNSFISLLTNTNVDKSSKNTIIQNINKIPLIDISNDDYRLFTVKILGDLNKEGFVKSFNWLN